MIHRGINHSPYSKRLRPSKSEIIIIPPELRHLEVTNLADKTCSIVGCDKPVKRSFPTKRIANSIRKAGLETETSRYRRTYLCRQHWKIVKKEFKKKRDVERLRWGP